MTDLTALKELLERVEKAEGPDRELDHDIATKLAQLPVRICIGDGIITEQRWVPFHAPHYTSSIDACVALIEKVLPEANCYGFDLTPTCVGAYVSRNNVKSGHWLKYRSHSTAPLAFLAALLSALIAKEESNA